MAVGIGLVFGVLRLVNFAYGQLIMAGAYTLAYTSQLAGRLEHRRLLRGRDRALAGDGARGLPAAARAIADGDARDDVRDLVRAAERRAADRHPRRPDRRARVVARVAEPGRSRSTASTCARSRSSPCSSRSCALGALALLLGRTEIGLRMRAAATDFRTARMLGVKANQVIGLAVVLSGALAAAVAVILTVQTPFVTPDFALHDTIIVLVGVVVGGIDRLWTATLGGFAIGFASGIVNGALPTDKTSLPAVGRVRARDPRAARCGRPGSSCAGARRWSIAYERRARADRAARPDAARRARRLARHARLAGERACTS